SVPCRPRRAASASTVRRWHRSAAAAAWPSAPDVVAGGARRAGPQTHPSRGRYSRPVSRKGGCMSQEEGERLGKGILTLPDVVAQSVGYMGPVFSGTFFIPAIIGLGFAGKGA